MMYYAHTKQEDKSLWEPLYTDGWDVPIVGHLNRCARLASCFASGVSPYFPHVWGECGRMAGLWHDLGKFLDEFQVYLEKSADGDSVVRGSVDHAIVGARYAVDTLFPADLSPISDLFAYVIAGHHSGLPDGDSLFNIRLLKEIGEWKSHAPASLLEPGILAKSWLEAIQRICPERKGGILGFHPCMKAGKEDSRFAGFAVAMQVRMLFSCLVDADCLASEEFMSPDSYRNRPVWPEDILQQMSRELEENLREKEEKNDGSPISSLRREIHHSCLEQAFGDPGIYRLNVPTGGGKTLSSLSFALKHALVHGLKRVIYVIPYTSIIDQTASEFRQVFDRLSKELNISCVLEHHSNINVPEKKDEDGDSLNPTVLAENWDAPLILTTGVQFFESLFSNRPSACRKLHRMAQAVVIFDEAQTLPVSLLSPCLKAMQGLHRDYGSTVVLCTATQPPLEKSDDFPIGWDHGEQKSLLGQEMEERLFSNMKRVKLSSLGELDVEALVEHVVSESLPSCLLIVNLTGQAQAVYRALEQNEQVDRDGLFHLSARMRPVDRDRILKLVKKRLRLGEPVVLVATPVVEAGVDLSFHVVYRDMAGVDSIAQAAGRCNRHGEYADGGRVFLFASSDYQVPKKLPSLRKAQAATRDVLGSVDVADLLEPHAVDLFFEHYYQDHKDSTDRWDTPGIVEKTATGASNPTKMYRNMKFKAVAESFQMIPEQQHRIMIVRAGEKEAEAIYQEFKWREQAGLMPPRDLYQKAGWWSVNVYDNDWVALQHGKVEKFARETIFIVPAGDDIYDANIGFLSSKLWDPNWKAYMI